MGDMPDLLLRDMGGHMFSDGETIGRHFNAGRIINGGYISNGKHFEY